MEEQHELTIKECKKYVFKQEDHKRSRKHCK